MKIQAKCPRCKRDVHLAMDMADKRVRCPNCRRLFKIPDTKDLQKALSILDDANCTIYVDANGNVYG